METTPTAPAFEPRHHESYIRLLRTPRPETTYDPPPAVLPETFYDFLPRILLETPYDPPTPPRQFEDEDRQQ